VCIPSEIFIPFFSRNQNPILKSENSSLMEKKETIDVWIVYSEIRMLEQLKKKQVFSMI